MDAKSTGNNFSTKRLTETVRINYFGNIIELGFSWN